MSLSATTDAAAVEALGQTPDRDHLAARDLVLGLGSIHAGIVSLIGKQAQLAGGRQGLPLTDR
jgi:hypothetical protein